MEKEGFEQDEYRNEKNDGAQKKSIKSK